MKDLDPDYLGLDLLSRKELEQKYRDLELVLCDIQESSHELEKALEEELRDTELRYEQQQAAYKKLEARANRDRQQVESLTQELNSLYESSRETAVEWESLHARLAEQLVIAEIDNDTMETNDRALQQQLYASQKISNDLLERLALTDHDLERERASSASKQLYIENYQRQVRELTMEIHALKSHCADYDAQHTKDADIAMLSMRDVLKTEPPTSQYANRAHSVPKSASLQRLHAMQRDVSIYMSQSAPNLSKLSQNKVKSQNKDKNIFPNTKKQSRFNVEMEKSALFKDRGYILQTNKVSLDVHQKDVSLDQPLEPNQLEKKSSVGRNYTHEDRLSIMNDHHHRTVERKSKSLVTKSSFFHPFTQLKSDTDAPQKRPKIKIETGIPSVTNELVSGESIIQMANIILSSPVIGSKALSTTECNLDMITVDTAPLITIPQKSFSNLDEPIKIITSDSIILQLLTNGKVQEQAESLLNGTESFPRTFVVGKKRSVSGKHKLLELQCAFYNTVQRLRHPLL